MQLSPRRPGAGSASGRPAGGSAPALWTSAAIESDKQAILDNVIKLIQTAPLKPGGDNFAIATQNLNKYFSGVRPEKFTLAPATRALLLQQMPEAVVQDLQDRTFRMPDARHIEDCMLYHSVATRVGGVGDDEARVRRVFRWIVEQIQLVPPGALAAPRLGQAEARPYDVLMRGMATEDGGSWAERGWLFLVLCRQLGVDACLLTYTPPGAKDPVVWTCAALIDGKLCLFDTRLGLEIPGPGGVGVATLDDALADPGVLARLDLPGQSSYRTGRDSLLASPSKIGVLIDSSPHYRSPRMELLQEDLAGRNRTILYSDVSGERDRLLRALGKHAGSVDFWELPARVEHLLFTNPKFVEATLYSLVLFDPNRFPLVYARMKQLHGELPEAIQDYVTFRFAENPIEVNKQTLIPAEIQQALDIYATYFLATVPPGAGRRRPGRVLLQGDVAAASRARPGAAVLQHVPLGRAGQPWPTLRGPRRRRPRHRLLHAVRSDLAAARQPRSAPASSSGARPPPIFPRSSLLRRSPRRPLPCSRRRRGSDRRLDIQVTLGAHLTSSNRCSESVTLRTEKPASDAAVTVCSVGRSHERNRCQRSWTLSTWSSVPLASSQYWTR